MTPPPVSNKVKQKGHDTINHHEDFKKFQKALDNKIISVPIDVTISFLIKCWSSTTNRTHQNHILNFRIDLFTYIPHIHIQTILMCK